MIELENKILDQHFNGELLSEVSLKDGAWRQGAVKWFLLWRDVFGGIFPEYIRQAAEEGRLFQYGLDLDLPSIEQITNAADSVVICRVKTKQLLKMADAVCVRTLEEIQVERIQAAIVTPKMVKEYLLAIGGKYNSDHTLTGVQAGVDWGLRKVAGEWQFSIDRGPWVAFHKYAAINGVAELNVEKIVVLFMCYILSVRNASDITGRAAFTQFLFEDRVNMGWDSSTFSAFRKNKVSLLWVKSLSLDGAKPGCPVRLGDNKTYMLDAANSFESKGISILMHKSAKYLVADAAMAGFHRNADGSYNLPYKADKLPKTNRFMAGVPTAAELMQEGDLPRGKGPF